MRDVLNSVPWLKLRNPDACFHTGDQLNTDFDGRPLSEDTARLLKFNSAGQLIDWDQHMDLWKNTVKLADGRRGYHDHGKNNAEAQEFYLPYDKKGRQGFIYVFKPSSSVKWPD